MASIYDIFNSTSHIERVHFCQQYCLSLPDAVLRMCLLGCKYLPTTSFPTGIQSIYNRGFKTGETEHTATTINFDELNNIEVVFVILFGFLIFVCLFAFLSTISKIVSGFVLGVLSAIVRLIAAVLGFLAAVLTAIPYIFIVPIVAIVIWAVLGEPDTEKRERYFNP